MTSRTVFAAFVTPIFLLLGLCYSWYTPLWSPPDEELHYAYCEYIARNHAIPHLSTGTDRARISQAFHPPLYYLIGSLFCSKQGKPIQEQLTVNDGPGYAIIKYPGGETVKGGSAHLLRIFSLFLSLITVYCIYSLVLTVFPGETVLAAATALFVATNPQFLHISASISNETLVATFSTIYIVCLVRYCKHTVTIPYSIVMGLILGCGLLAKTSAVFLIPITVCVILFYRFRDWKRFLIDCIVVFGTALLTAGWWYRANWFMLTHMQTSQPWFTRSTPLSIEYLKTMLGYTFMSFFGYFGALQIPLKSIHLLFYGVILLLGTLGLCRLAIRRSLNSFQYQVLVILLIAFLGGLGIFASLNLKYYAFLGKYLFVVLAPIASLIFVGLRTLIPVHWRKQVFVLLSILMIVVNLDVLFRILKPAFAEPRLALGVDQSMFCCLKPAINDITTISQTFVSPSNKLCAIRAMFFCQSQRTDGDLVFILKETGGQGKIVRQMLYPMRKIIKGIDRYFFIFPPIMDSRGKEYQVSFSARSVSAGEGISLGYNVNDRYPRGRMFVNGAPAEGDLYFQTYCFTGDHPETDWEGRREVIMDQMYVSVRESQLYSEMSREFRKKTIIHEKLLRAEKALQRSSFP